MTPQPRFQWTVTRLGLTICFAILHAMVVGGLGLLYFEYCADHVGSGAGYEEELGPSGSTVALACLVYTGPLFGPLWMLALVHFMRRYRSKPGRCDFCGWKLPVRESTPCRSCGALRVRYCQKCGYDLTGNVSGRCPECGRAGSRLGSR